MEDARSSRLQSPTRFNRLGSNDDDLERVQARVAVRRRKSIAQIQALASVFTPHATRKASDNSDLMDKDQLIDLVHNCIRLSSENKINQKNTWELGLIDHMSEIIKVESEEDNETNFQKASCTLEAGVKIYSLRVDSVHSEAYKVLAGINRAGRDEDKEGSESNVDGVTQEAPLKKEIERKLSPMSTLESFEALNVKKFDVAFSVDPLYHQTSAQFDEGGAKGLLLRNLGVYGPCRVLFDSFEIPDKCSLSDEFDQINKDQTIDLSFAKESIENMINNVLKTKEITPTLKEILEHLDEDNKRPCLDTILSSLDQGSGLTEEEVINKDDDYHAGPTWEYENDNNGFNYDDGDDGESVIDEGSVNNMNSSSYQEESGDFAYEDQNGDEKLEKIADFLSLGLGFSSKTNAWAGPDHWKFPKIKGSELSSESAEKPELVIPKKRTRKEIPDIDFSKSLDEDNLKSLFAPPKNSKSLLLTANRAPCNNRLPEDRHYRPDSLVKLFLLSDVLCLGRKGMKQSHEEREGENDDDGFVPPASSWDDDDAMSENGNDFGNDYFDPDDEPGSLLRKPRQVNKIDIQYDKVSKQVDVHALKEILWDRIQHSVEDTETEKEKDKEETISLKNILQRFPKESPNEISPHLFFICLLHLANEHGLSLRGRPSLDEIDIELPSIIS